MMLTLRYHTPMYIQVRRSIQILANWAKERTFSHSVFLYVCVALCVVIVRTPQSVRTPLPVGAHIFNNGDDRDRARRYQS